MFYQPFIPFSPSFHNPEIPQGITLLSPEHPVALSQTYRITVYVMAVGTDEPTDPKLPLQEFVARADFNERYQFHPGLTPGTLDKERHGTLDW